MAAAHRIYARALFDAAKASGRIDVISGEFDQFARALDEVPELRALVENPQLDSAARTGAFQAVLADADELFRNYLLVLAEKSRIGELEAIHREFETLLAAEADVMEVELTTAVDLSDTEAREILERIERASGKTIRATRAVDPGLIGGVVLKVGSHRLDASVRGRLERLRQAFTVGAA